MNSTSNRPVVVVADVSKKYSRNSNIHLSYGILDLFREFMGRSSSIELRTDEFIAVDQVSFELEAGDSLALVGRNGAGKSTLLKMMNGLTKPDAGSIIMDGRVQALINLGAGFNQLLSGRENIYNSAALMGLTYSNITDIVDEIVDFAEIDDFIESPVQTYSSGMKARLGFSVAVHLQPDILLIDEILSVGDIAFQNKCFVKLQEMKAAGVTLVLVTHSPTNAIQTCTNALWIEGGRVMALGPAKETIQAYLDFLEDFQGDRIRKANAIRKELAQKRQNESDQIARTVEEENLVRDKKAGSPGHNSLFHAIHADFDQISDLSVSLLVGNRETDIIRVHDKVEIQYSFRLLRRVADLNVSLVFYRKDGLQLTTISSLNESLFEDVHEGTVKCSVAIEDMTLAPGNYVLVMPIHEGKSYLYRDIVKEFVVKGGERLSWGVLDFKYSYHIEK